MKCMKMTMDINCGRINVSFSSQASVLERKIKIWSAITIVIDSLNITDCRGTVLRLKKKPKHINVKAYISTRGTGMRRAGCVSLHSSVFDSHTVWQESCVSYAALVFLLYLQEFHTAMCKPT